MAELAHDASIPAFKISAFEAGTDFPTWSELKRIAKGVSRPTSIFFFSSLPEEQQKPTDFRLLPSNELKVIPHELMTQLRLIEYKRELFIELNRSFRHDPTKFLLKANLADDPETIAQTFRSAYPRLDQIILDVGDKAKAFVSWRNFIESLDVLVFQLSGFELETFRGVALHFDEVPVIVINAKDSEAGKIFSLLHEFYHLMLNVSGISNNETPKDTSSDFNEIEYKANRFSGALIAPSDKITEYFAAVPANSFLDPKGLRLASRRLKVSEDVIARRLYDLGFINRAKYLAWYEARKNDFLEKASRKKEKQKAKEGGPAPAIISRAYQSPTFLGRLGDGVSARLIHKADAASALGLTISSFEKVMVGNS